jgi:hypothetical protein
MRKKWKSSKLDKYDRIQLGLSYFFRLALVFALGFAIWRQEWITVFLSGLAFALTFLPSFIERRFEVTLPNEFEFFITIFVYSSLYLGEVRDYYLVFWWWDALLHATSGLILGLIGFVVVFMLNKEKQVRLEMSPAFLCLFAFTFAVALGAVWEIIEYSVDFFFTTNMQASGLVDTMGDLIIDTAGALIVSFLGYFYIKSGKRDPLTKRLLKKFEEHNPHLF